MGDNISLGKLGQFGKVDLSKLKDLKKTDFNNSKTNKMDQSIFDKIDTNMDGVLNQEEIEALRLDNLTNDDGKISKKEAQNWLKANNFDMSVKDFFNAVKRFCGFETNEVTYEDGTKGTEKYDSDGYKVSETTTDADGTKVETIFAEDGETPVSQTTTYADGTIVETIFAEDGETPESEISTEADGTTIEIKYAKDSKTPVSQTTKKDGTTTKIIYAEDGETPIYSETIDSEGYLLEEVKINNDGTRTEWTRKNGTQEEITYAQDGKTPIRQETNLDGENLIITKYENGIKKSQIMIDENDNERDLMNRESKNNTDITVAQNNKFHNVNIITTTNGGNQSAPNTVVEIKAGAQFINGMPAEIKFQGKDLQYDVDTKLYTDENGNQYKLTVGQGDEAWTISKVTAESANEVTSEDNLEERVPLDENTDNENSEPAKDIPDFSGGNLKMKVSNSKISSKPYDSTIKAGTEFAEDGMPMTLTMSLPAGYKGVMKLTYDAETRTYKTKTGREFKFEKNDYGEWELNTVTDNTTFKKAQPKTEEKDPLPAENAKKDSIQTNGTTYVATPEIPQTYERYTPTDKSQPHFPEDYNNVQQMEDSLKSYGCTNVTITMTQQVGNGNNKYKIHYTQNGHNYHFEGHVHGRGRHGLPHHFQNVATASLN